MRNAVRDALTLLTDRYAAPGPVGLAHPGTAADVPVSRVVDIVKGVHGRISKADLVC
ncbi:hypothetical protein ACFY1U_49705 [Streptomyces sp. NPDC001351]|uniref:hypothetical protein n=1 Tax=Streptomyces sp. NPDC001351 TaxID=3364564 RepID=UPI0036C5E05D